MKCALCGDTIDLEHPLSLYGLNPETFRMAWMDQYCYDQAFEALVEFEASSQEFLNRQDEYLERIK